MNKNIINSFELFIPQDERMGKTREDRSQLSLSTEVKVRIFGETFSR